MLHKISRESIVTVPVRTPDGKGFPKWAKEFFLMWHRNNYDWMLFLTLPMAFNGDRNHDPRFTKLTR